MARGDAAHARLDTRLVTANVASAPRRGRSTPQQGVIIAQTRDPRRRHAPVRALARAGGSSAQWLPTVRTDTEMGDVGPLRIGISAGAVVPTGEAFYEVRDAASVQLFLAVPIEPFDDVRIGGGYSSHYDELDGNDVGVTVIFVETLFGFGHGSRRLRIGPRTVYVHQARDLFLNRMHGFGLGGMVSLAQSLGPRVAIEISASMTGTMLPGTDWRHEHNRDPDGWSNAWFRELRIGVTARPW